MNRRLNVRANLKAQMSLRGTDRSGQPLATHGHSVDFSWQGVGLLLEEDAFEPGSVITVSIPDKFTSHALIRWVRPDTATGKTRVGLQLINPKASFGLKLAASFLLCLAIISQAGFARSRYMARTASGAACTMSLAQMKDMLQKSLAHYSFITESDKAFIHAQHQHMSCEEFSRQYEQSDFYANPKTRAAIIEWHQRIYHAQDSAVRAAAIRGVEASLGASQ